MPSDPQAISNTPIGRMAVPSAAMAERNRRLQESPDAYFDPNRRDAAYRQRVEDHYAIGTFLHSTRRDDPRFRGLMIQLLENGYGIHEWVQTVGFLLAHNSPLFLQRQLMERASFSPQEIDDTLDPNTDSGKRIRHLMNPTPLPALAERTRIDDRSLLREFLSITLDDIKEGEEVLGNARARTLYADKLLTDSDWLDEEFLAALRRYTGPPREDYYDRFAAPHRIPAHLLSEPPAEHDE